MVLGCLALNASFEPLTMVPIRRALRLVIDGKAEIVEAEQDRVVRSERLVMPRPAVIRLTKFIHVPRRFRRQVTNTFLFARDHYRCQYCGRMQSELKPRESLTRDHVIPLSRGGTNAWTNVVAACSPCNTRKGNRAPEQANMPLIYVPYVPNRHEHFILRNRRILIFLAVWLVKDASWISLPALGATIIFTHLGLLVWELKYVAMSLAYPGLKPKPSTSRNPVSN
mgnify:CR=1 FL=1